MSIPMVALIVHFNLKAGSQESFDSLIDSTISQVKANEPETLVYVCHTHRDRKDCRVLYELYKSEQAFQFHGDRSYVKQFLEQRDQYLQASPQVEFLGPTAGTVAPNLYNYWDGTSAVAKKVGP